MRLVVSRFNNRAMVVLDWTLSAVAFVWLFLLSASMSSYWLNTKEKQNQFTRVWKFFVVGPLCLAGCIAVWPFGFTAHILQVILKCGFSSRNFYQVSFDGDSPETPGVHKDKPTLTIVTANVFEQYDIFGKRQNMGNSTERMWQQFSAMWDLWKPTVGGRRNLDPGTMEPDSELHRDQTIEWRWPSDVDIICLQELWDRGSALAYMLAIRLSSREFKHFIFDTSRYGWKYNTFCGGGLMVASKLPILESEFCPCENTQTWEEILLNYGMLNLKLDVGPGGRGSGNKRHVGYLTNLHLSYSKEARDRVLLFDEVLSSIRSFENRTNGLGSETSEPKFRLICGDFNFAVSADHPQAIDHDLFREFVDLPGESEDADKAWAWPTWIITDKIHSPHVQDATSLRSTLMDPKLKADLLSGRYDRILFDPNLAMGRPKNYFVLTCFGNASDHFPVTMTFEEKGASSDEDS